MDLQDDIAKQLSARGDRPVLGCFPPYPPVELFHSLGIIPVVLWGLDRHFDKADLSSGRIQSYACSVSRYLAEFVLSDRGKLLDGIFTYNTCDTLRNLPEILQEGLKELGTQLPFFNIHVPLAPRCQTDSDGYLVNEIVALIGALERTFHTEFSREAFMRSVELYRRARSLAAELEQSVARGDLSFSRFASVLQWNHVLPVEDQITRLELLRSETEDETLAKRRFRPTATVVISGILPPMEEISEMIEDAGLRVVGNDVASMRRSYGYTPPVADEPGAYYVDLYGNHYPCTTLLHTADERIERLVGLVEQTGADGFLFAGVKYCENEYFELPLCREVLEQRGVPTLDLEFTVGDRRNLATYRTRIEAFAEMMDSNHGDA